MKRRTIQFCGAFEGTAKMHRDETPEEALERIENLLANAFGRVRSVDAMPGVDFHDYTVQEES